MFATASLQRELRNISEVSTLLSEVQRSWVFLENLFIFSDEVKKELPEESDKFVGIDMDVKEILMNGFQVKSAKEFCNQGSSAQCFSVFFSARQHLPEVGEGPGGPGDVSEGLE